MARKRQPTGQFKIELRLPARKGSGKEKIWKQVASECSHLIKKLEKTIPRYSYEDKETSLVTDEKVCSVIVESMRKAKDLLFNLIEFFYEMHQEQHMNKELESLRDAVDVFSDEIKGRYCSWKGINKNWMVKIVRHDVQLLEQTAQFLNTIQTLHDGVFAAGKPRRTKKGAEYVLEQWDSWKATLTGVGKELNELVLLFKERESMCNLTALDLKHTYEVVQEHLKDEFS